MDRKVRRKLAMAGRVLEFARANPSEGAGWTAVLTRLEELLSRGREVEVAEQEGRLGAREARARRRELRDRIHRDMVVHLVHTAEVAFKAEPGRREGFRFPKVNAPYRAYVTAARTLLGRALPERAALEAAGLGESLLDDLAKALEAFDAAEQEAVTRRREHVSARQALLALVDEVIEQVQLVDGLLRPRLRGNRELAAAWEMVRQLDGPELMHRNGVVGAIAPSDSADASGGQGEGGTTPAGGEMRDAV